MQNYLNPCVSPSISIQWPWALRGPSEDLLWRSGVDLKPVLTVAATAGNFGLGLLWSTGGSHQTCWTLLRWHGGWKHLLFPLALRMWVAWGALVQPSWVNLSWSQYFTVLLRWCQVMCLNRSASEEDSQHHHWYRYIIVVFLCFPYDIARQVASDGFRML